MGTPGVRKNSGASQKVLAYLRDHANTTIPYHEIQEHFGYDTSHVVSNAIQHLIAKGIYIERPMRGIAIYRTGPVAAPVKEAPKPESPNLFEIVGKAGEAGMIVRDMDGELWLARPIKEILT